MKRLLEVIDEIVRVYQYGDAETDGTQDILRRYAESVVDACSNSDKLQTLGLDNGDEVWIHRDSIQKIKEQI